MSRMPNGSRLVGRAKSPMANCSWPSRRAELLSPVVKLRSCDLTFRLPRVGRWNYFNGIRPRSRRLVKHLAIIRSFLEDCARYRRDKISTARRSSISPGYLCGAALENCENNLCSLRGVLSACMSGLGGNYMFSRYVTHPCDTRARLKYIDDGNGIENRFTS